jgi:hypothetical protein
MGFKEQLARLFGRSSGSAEPKQLPRQSVEHDSIDKMVFDRLRRQAPSFGQAVTDAPLIPPAIQEPDPLDFTTATPEEIAKWQEDVKAAREAAENMPPYDNFEELARDLFYSYHHRRKPKILEPGEVDPGVAAHPKIIQRIFTTDDHRKSRNITKDDETMSALATRATVRKLKEILSDQLAEQARQSQEFEKARSEANELQQSLDELREQAREQHQQQGHADPELVEEIKQAVKEKRAAQAQAARSRRLRRSRSTGPRTMLSWPPLRPVARRPRTAAGFRASVRASARASLSTSRPNRRSPSLRCGPTTRPCAQWRTCTARCRRTSTTAVRSAWSAARTRSWT